MTHISMISITFWNSKRSPNTRLYFFCPAGSKKRRRNNYNWRHSNNVHYQYNQEDEWLSETPRQVHIQLGFFVPPGSKKEKEGITVGDAGIMLIGHL